MRILMSILVAVSLFCGTAAAPCASEQSSELVLYIKPSCPYCKKVLSFMKEAGINVPQKDINTAPNREELLQGGGKKQVPCLFIDGKALYESDDIIQWLKNHKH